MIKFLQKREDYFGSFNSFSVVKYPIVNNIILAANGSNIALDKKSKFREYHKISPITPIIKENAENIYNANFILDLSLSSLSDKPSFCEDHP